MERERRGGRAARCGRVSTPEEPELPRAASLSAVAFPRASGVEAPVCAFNPGDGKVVLEAYIMEELANALDERFVTAGLD